MTEPGSERLLPARAPSRVPASSPLYPAVRSSELTLRDGTRALLRPVGPADRELIAEGFERLSPESRYRRFFAPLKALPGNLLDYLTSIDYVDHFAWGALVRDDGGGWLGVGVSRYVRLDGDAKAAEAAVTVVDDWQGRGLGRILLDALVLEALANGITRFEGEVLVENLPMQELLRRTGARFQPEGDGVLRFSIDLPARDEALRGSLFDDLLRALARGEASLYQDEPCPWVSGPGLRSGLEG
ncbi:MAG TPA: GNAT family N-acetyltransferase [Acidimicrobiia bacterium]|nr:GNAT family N-acetyltransferase [Acidimicrobiia bacterium]